jgi:hypothetical protein
MLLTLAFATGVRATVPDAADESFKQFLAQDDTQRPYRAVRRLEAANGSLSGERNRHGWTRECAAVTAAEDRFLVSGMMVLNADDGALVRLQGRLAKSPSFWVKNVHIVRIRADRWQRRPCRPRDQGAGAVPRRSDPPHDLRLHRNRRSSARQPLTHACSCRTAATSSCARVHPPRRRQASSVTRWQPLRSSRKIACNSAANARSKQHTLLSSL